MAKSYDFLYWAYNIIWIAIAAYVAFLMVRLTRVRDRLERLEKSVGQGKDSARGQGSAGS